MLDVGLYNNPRQFKFTQIEPGLRDEKSRKDDLRGSPVVSMSIITEVMEQEKQVSATPKKSDSTRLTEKSKEKQLEMSFDQHRFLTGNIWGV